MAIKEVALDNDWEFEVKISRKNASTGVLEPASGLVTTDYRFWFSLTDDGTAISASVTVTPQERAGAPGVYFGVILGDDIRTHLASLVGQTIYEVFSNVVSAHIESSVARRVVAIRRPIT